MHDQNTYAGSGHGLTYLKAPPSSYHVAPSTHRRATLCSSVATLYIQLNTLHFLKVTGAPGSVTEGSMQHWPIVVGDGVNVQLGTER